MLSVFIEGDGLAWLGRCEPSLDPTPLDPLALRMALGALELVGYPGGGRRSCITTLPRFATTLTVTYPYA